MLQNFPSLMAAVVIFGAIGFRGGQWLSNLLVELICVRARTEPPTYGRVAVPTLLGGGVILALIVLAGAIVVLLVTGFGDTGFNVSFVGLGVLGTLAGYLLGVFYNKK